MPVVRVCDTNVFYDAATGQLKLADLRVDGAVLAVTPVSILEIASKVTDANFAQRQAAAAKALEADLILPDPEMHLASIWGVTAAVDEVPWRDALVAMADAKDRAQLEAGVEDAQAGVKRSVRVPIAHTWRSFHYRDFVDQVVSAVDQFVPGYAKKRAKGKMKQAGKETAAKLRLQFGGPTALLEVLLATRDRAYLVGNITTPPPPTQKDIEAAVEKLIVYISVYARYFEKVATVFAPQENDWGDLECFVYLQGDRLVATGEDRWLDIATELGCGHLVVDTKVYWTNSKKS